MRALPSLLFPSPHFCSVAYFLDAPSRLANDCYFSRLLDIVRRPEGAPMLKALSEAEGQLVAVFGPKPETGGRQAKLSESVIALASRRCGLKLLAPRMHCFCQQQKRNVPGSHLLLLPLSPSPPCCRPRVGCPGSVQLHPPHAQHGQAAPRLAARRAVQCRAHPLAQPRVQDQVRGRAGQGCRAGQGRAGGMTSVMADDP